MPFDFKAPEIAFWSIVFLYNEGDRLIFYDASLSHILVMTKKRGITVYSSLLKLSFIAN